MRRLVVVVVGTGVLASGLLGMLGACGSDDAATANSTDGGVANTPPSTATGTATGTTPGTTPPSSDPDAGDASASVPPPGAAPGKIGCGTDSCDAGGNLLNPNSCCQHGDGTASCGKAQDCDKDSLHLACDEPGDCPKLDFPGADTPRCCLNTKSGVFGPSTTCAYTACAKRLCRSNDDCGDGGTCSKKSCSGFDVFVCGTPEDCL